VKLRHVVLVGLLTVGCAAPATNARDAQPAATVFTSTVTGPSTTAVQSSTTTASRPVVPPRPTVRIAVVGDIMLGRGMQAIVAHDPEGLFEDVRRMLSDVDVAGANMESPLTNRPHIAANPWALEADPAVVELVASAGFDVLTVANNHAGDAGRASVVDSVEAIEATGMEPVGGGATSREASEPAIREVDGLRVGFLAYDATGAGTMATEDRPGIARWNDAEVESAVTTLRSVVDVLVVAIHGGVEYRTWTDPYMATLAEKLHDWGADVMWGSGPHVVQPVYTIDGDRPTVVATSLGNFVFDQGDPETEIGAVLEVLADADGAVAYRVATIDHHDKRVHFDWWNAPDGDATMIGMDLWSLARQFNSMIPGVSLDLEGTFRWGEVVDASQGDVDLDGHDEVVAAFLRPYQENPVNALFPDRPWADARGRSAHLGVFGTPGLRPEWIAGTLFRPVQRVVVCDGSLAVGYVLEDGSPASGAWRWRGFGFAVTPILNHDAIRGCADVDGDGRTDPILEVP
jgi:poly-gamma-glutamate capsule biosynthesis protein CapA/YwtB (metallophosphatase superfamily)